MRAVAPFAVALLVGLGCSSSSPTGAAPDASPGGEGGSGSGGDGSALSGSSGGSSSGSDGSASSSSSGGGSGSSSGGADSGSGKDGSTSAEGGGDSGTWWKPPVNTTFYWELANAPPTQSSENVGAYDIDGWENTAAEVTTLHGMGLKVVCYMDAGTFEPGRPDAASFPSSLEGAAVTGWPGELWLDVRPSGPNYAALQAIMLARFQQCQSKGFDAIEPDNIDSYQNSPGFPTTAADQLAYDEWIAQTAHSLGLAVFQKNDLDQIATLLPYFDGLLDEECNKYSECATLAPYVAAGKPVWNAEYTEDGETTSMFCASDVSAGIVGALFSVNLDGSLFLPCTNDVGKIN